ncbi:MAG: hypothetical protein IH946_07060, partial [Bacteroidetes bacterium]|nr:hypothetical protein [Bacteroidota bacterium]
MNGNEHTFTSTSNEMYFGGDASFINVKLGLGTKEPVGVLHVRDYGTTEPAIFIEGASGTEGDIAWNKGESFQLGEWDKNTSEFTQRIKVNSTGHFGVGTNNPQAAIHANSFDGRPALYLENADDNEGDITWKDGQHLQVGEWDPNTSTFTEHLIIRNNGRVGIGTPNPAGLLHVAGAVFIDDDLDVDDDANVGHDLDIGDDLDIGGTLSFSGSLGDKISLFGNRIGQTNMYGFGVESNNLYYKASAGHRWYVGDNADNGGDAVMSIKSNGFVGIGTDNPSVPLTIEANNARLVLRDGSGQNSSNAARIEMQENDNGNFGAGCFIRYDGSANKMIFGTKKPGEAEKAVLVIKRSGLNVGIGTSNPNNAYRLSVNGKVRCKEVVVEVGWSDFVFAEDYDLRPLSEVDEYICKNNHLPDIPSGQDVENGGLSLGAMQSSMMQKIEELTLYMIDQDKAIKELKAENIQLRSNMDELQNS